MLHDLRDRAEELLDLSRYAADQLRVRLLPARLHDVQADVHAHVHDARGVFRAGFSQPIRLHLLAVAQGFDDRLQRRVLALRDPLGQVGAVRGEDAVLVVLADGVEGCEQAHDDEDEEAHEERAQDERLLLLRHGWEGDADGVAAETVGVAVALAVGDLLGVGEALVGLGELVELFVVEVLFVGVLVRVVLARQLAVGLLDVRDRGERGDAEHLVGVEAAHELRVGELLVGVVEDHEEQQPGEEFEVVGALAVEARAPDVELDGVGHGGRSVAVLGIGAEGEERGEDDGPGEGDEEDDEDGDGEVEEGELGDVDVLVGVHVWEFY